MEEKKENILDLTVIVPMLLKRWKLYAYCIVGVIIFSLVFVFTIPRYYTCQIMLAPEATDGSGMNSILSSFGFGEAPTTNDAISPNLYPDLMNSKDFIVSMFPVKITTLDGKLTTTYYDYLLHHNKTSQRPKYGEEVRLSKFLLDQRPIQYFKHNRRKVDLRLRPENRCGFC